MRIIMSIVVSAFLLFGQTSAADEQETKKDTMTQKQKVSYSIGVDMARNIRRHGVEVDMDLVTKGLRDVLSGGKLLMTDDELRKTLNTFQAEIKLKQIQARRMAAEDNRKKGEAFLSENKKKEGVVTLPSGLQYKILKEGNGKKPTEADTVECNYRGALIDGTELDSSKAGKPNTLKVTGVIPGWKEALQLMPVGSKWQLFIPPHLAYGERGAAQIGPNATLIFEVELLAIH
jgi:FKBP-type peptidyl-prolyl cis-trans isomerase FklB